MSYCKIFSNGVLVRDFVPVRIGQTGYMYDKVTGQLFGNSGTGEFVLGPDKHSLHYDAEIEYLEGTGTQWIDTGIVSSIGDSISITISTNDFVNTFLCGARKDSNGMENSFFVYGQVNGKISFASNDGYDASSVDIQDGFIHTIEHKADGGYVDGVKVVSRSFTMSPSSRSYAVLTVNDREEKTNISACKLYNFVYYRSGVKIMELIPVRVGTTGYMYDKVSGQLFGNSGTGNFVLGSDKS